jgi:hypothetical protein
MAGKHPRKAAGAFLCPARKRLRCALYGLAKGGAGHCALRPPRTVTAYVA